MPEETKGIILKKFCCLLLILCICGSCRDKTSPDREPESKRSNIVTEMYLERNASEKKENINSENYNNLLKTFDTSFFKLNDTLNSNCSTFMYQKYLHGNEFKKKNMYNHYLNMNNENHLLLY